VKDRSNDNSSDLPQQSVIPKLTLGFVVFWLFVCLTLTSTKTFANNFCFHDAAIRYGVSEKLLMAISKTESEFNASATNHNKNGTKDIGHMQINSTHLDELIEYDIDERKLYRDPCINTNIGAWILSKNIAKFGNTWKAVGAYNTGPNGSPEKQKKYVRRVAKNLALLERK